MSKKVEFQYISPVLASSDVARDIEWYETKLGFKNVFDSTAYQEGPIDYAVIGRDKLFFHLQFQFPEDMTSTDLKFQVKNIKALLEQYVAAGVVSEDSMNWKTPWGTAEFAFFDPSGNRLTFLEDL